MLHFGVVEEQGVFRPQNAIAKPLDILPQDLLLLKTSSISDALSLCVLFFRVLGPKINFALSPGK